jgi:hypothetical protein
VICQTQDTLLAGGSTIRLTFPARATAGSATVLAVAGICTTIAPAGVLPVHARTVLPIRPSTTRLAPVTVAPRTTVTSTSTTDLAHDWLSVKVAGAADRRTGTTESAPGLAPPPVRSTTTTTATAAATAAAPAQYRVCT